MCAVAGALVVLCRDGQKLAGAIADALCQPARSAGVAVAPLGLEHGVVGRLVQQLVHEREFLSVAEGTAGAGRDQVALLDGDIACRKQDDEALARTTAC